jgi:putative two-component system response regulator
MQMEDKRILIVDDMELDRDILAEAFRDEYEILEATNGAEALDIMAANDDISAVLLDLKMPEMNGIETLKEMNRNGKIQFIPVFVTTVEDDESMLLDAYNLGAVDVIRKPFMLRFIKCRIDNIVELYMHRNDMRQIISEQVERLNRQNRSLVETLAAIIEFRDGESGGHVKRMSALSGILMKKAGELYPEYNLPDSEIDKITMAAILHDIGKISIPDRILTKPGRLTPEEFEIMKQHTVKGCEILENLPDGLLDKDIYEYCYDICRHHHERWDGRGYPDGLRGDEITVCSQIVAMADVYDALTSSRVYKPPYDHETAVTMILNGECGVFNPKVVEAFRQSLDVIAHRDNANIACNL